jgi:acyl-coenzyme A synthetase/AMP-(fatty) acid ligase
MFGLVGGLLNALFRGHTFAIPPLPQTDNGGFFPSSQTLLTYALRVRATEFFGVSSAVVGLARVNGGLDLLKTMKRVLVGGAPMPRENGDWIVRNGVHLVEGVGSTEGGSLVGFAMLLFFRRDLLMENFQAPF